MQRSVLVAILVVPALALAGGPKKAGTAAPTGLKAGPKATTLGPCGAKVLPLVEGNEWTYAAVGSPAAPTDQIKRISPIQPKTVVITVKSVEKSGAETVVTLEEKTTIDLTKDEKKPLLDERTIETTITCSKTKFEISPDSFFFAGEPGGYYGLKLDKVDRSRDTSWKLINGGIGDKPWREDIVAHWTREATPGSDAKLGAGKLELERAFQPENPELIITKLAAFHADKLALTTTGRVTLENSVAVPTAQEMPAGWIGTFWFTDSVGVVQVINAYFQAYQLVDAKLK